MKDSQRKAMFVNINKNNVDQIAADDIFLTVNNDGDFHKKVVDPNANTIANRMKRGKFEKEILFKKKSFIDRLGKEALNAYEGDLPKEARMRGVTPDTKRVVGQMVAERIFDIATERNRFQSTAKKKFLLEQSEKETGFDTRKGFHMANKNIESAMRSI